MPDPTQPPFDVAVVMVTVARPTLTQALRSVYAQQFGGRVQVLLGIDRWQGDRELVAQLTAQAPSHVAVTLLDLGYSTSQRHGGVYPSYYGGALKSIMSFAAHSRYVTYLDDDNWYAPTHLASMLAAVAGKDWAFSLRQFVDADSGEPLCPDTWESLGPDRGVYAQAQGGFVDTNCFLFDVLACADVFHEWALTRAAGGTGGDRQILQRVRDRPFGTNAAHTVYYRQRLAGLPPYMLWKFRCAGVDLARYVPPEAIPGTSTWQECADYDRRQASGATTTGAKVGR